MRIGSLFSGAGGLDMAVEAVFGANTMWHCELDPGASKVLATRWPGVPNLGDITAVDWSAAEPVDILCGGWPCQPFSLAGKRKGADDERALWPYVARAVRLLRPRIVVLENVSGVLGPEFQRVANDLATSGYDIAWTCLRASDVGAPHGRERLFVIAHPSSDGFTWGAQPHINAQQPKLAASQRYDIDRPAVARGDQVTLLPTPTSRDYKGAVNPLARPPRPDNGRVRTEGDNSLPDAIEEMAQGSSRWGRYEPAVIHWETLTRPAPAPAGPGRNGPRIQPPFSEWMMGWPAGWVTDVPGISRNDALRIIGNGVVPQQATAALQWLLQIAEVAA